MWERTEQRVTLVVRKSIDCHSSHYSLSQETKGNKGEERDGWCLMRYRFSPTGGCWMVSTIFFVNNDFLIEFFFNLLSI